MYIQFITDQGHQLTDALTNRFLGAVYAQELEVPADPNRLHQPGYARQQFLNTQENFQALNKIAYAATHLSLLILTDIDGTGSRFTLHAKDSRMAKGYVDALVALDHEKECKVAGVTGRPEHLAVEILGHTNDAYLPFDVICSHGTVFVMRDGTRIEITLTDQEKAFLLKARTTGERIKEIYREQCDFQSKHSGIDIKLDISLTPDHIERVRESLKILCEMSDNPLVEGNRAFSVHNEGPLETSIRLDRADKKRAIREFILGNLKQPNENFLPLFICDSLGKGGTDRAAAEYVQSLGGIVLQVLNDRPECSPDANDIFQPDAILANPDMAARFWQHIAAQRKHNRQTGLQFKPASV